MNDERPLELLKMLAEQDRDSQAPADAEMRLRREFRRDRARRTWRRRVLWSGAAVAAGLVLAVAVPRLAPNRKAPALQGVVVHELTQNTAGQRPPAMQEPATEKTTVSAHNARPAEVTAPEVAVTSGNQAGRRERGRPAAVRTAAAISSPRPSGAEETVTDFFLLLDPAPPFERGEILRVNLPASVMQTVGLPVREERLGERVQADVLVGEEGLPRAIRFVRTDMR
jgi:hypothetical protein